MTKRRVGSQIGTRPLKVNNRPNSLMCGWRATYRWKDFDKGYNFALDLISIGVLHTKLWVSKIAKIPILEFQDSNLGIPGQNDIWVLVLWPGTEYIIGGKWWLPPSLGCGEFCESMFAYGSFVHQNASTMH
jgi:hypothetical protein